jgi:enoyl-CoA hydratase/carnithine racemase
MNQPVIIEDQGPVRWITLDRSDCRNALTPAIVATMREAIVSATQARAIGITGLHGAFCSGLDLRTMMESGPELLEKADEHLARFQDLVRAIVAAPQPVVAAVDGAAVGFGCDLALACDVRVASTRAYFQESFTKIGLIPDGGGTWMLPRLIGLAKALEVAMLAEKLDAPTAHQLGLVWKVVPDATLAEEGRALALRLASGPPMALSRLKRLMRDGLAREFADGLTAEGRAQVECLRSADCIEGVTAFFQKRPPAFTGR